MLNTDFRTQPQPEGEPFPEEGNAPTPQQSHYPEPAQGHPEINEEFIVQPTTPALDGKIKVKTTFRRSVSYKLPDGTIDNYTAEASWESPVPMTVSGTSIIEALQTLANGARISVAQALDVEYTNDTENNRILIATPKSQLTTTAMYPQAPFTQGPAPAAPMPAMGAPPQQQGFGQPGFAPPQQYAQPAQPMQQGFGGGGGGNGRNNANYTKEQAAALWTLSAQQPQLFQNQLQGQYPSIIPSLQALQACGIQPPMDGNPKKLYAKNAPDWVKQQLMAQGIQIPA